MGDWQDLPLLPTGAARTPGATSRYAAQVAMYDLMAVRVPNRRGFSIVNTPALASPFGTSGSQARGIAYIFGGNNDKNSIWSVVGTHLWRGANDEGALAGISASGALQVVPAGNSKAVIVDPINQKAWCADRSGGSMVITAIALPSAAGIAAAAWQDGYTIYLETGTNVWWISAIDDPTTIGALDFTSADAVPDRNVGALSVAQELLIFGERHVEFWYDSGDNTFPFKRQQPGVLNLGLDNARAAVTHNGTAYFVSRDATVYALTGYQAQRISTRDVEQAITGAGGIGSVIVSAYSDAAGQSYICVTVPSGPNLVYDITDGTWHGRTHNTASNSLTWYGGMVTLNRVTYVAANPSIAAGAHCDVYQLDDTVFRDSNVSEDINRSIVLPPFDASGRRIFEADVRLDAARTKGTSGKVAFSYCDSHSPDLDTSQGFITHGVADFEGTSSPSAQSTDQDSITWSRCGMYRTRAHRFDIKANARITINGAQHRFEVGT